MTARDQVTSYYDVQVTVKLVERNKYGDALNDNVVTFTRELKTPNGIAGIGYLLTQLDNAIIRTKEMSR